MDILLNSKTGEIKTVECPFRSITDLKGYRDGESYKPGSSLVDLTGYESLESIVRRCTRVMRSPGGQVVSVLDKHLIAQECQFSDPVYEASGAGTIDEAFDKASDVTDTPAFDLADASALLSSAVNNNELSPATKPADNSKSKPAELAVGNSSDDSAEDNSEQLHLEEKETA